MKNNVLVVAADKNYISQAKQLFSSVHFNAGWKGDYLLLAHDIPEIDLVWFIDKGIIIKNINPISEKMFGRVSNATLDKFYMFKSEFKNWKKVVYLDVDIIIRSSIDGLLNIDGFGAISEGKLGNLFIKTKELCEKFNNRYNFKEPRFNAGVMAFNTNIINEKTFDEILSTYKEYEDVCTSDQEALNIYFYKNWENLPFFYNTNVYTTTACYFSGKKKLKGILHFIGNSKPWDKKNPFFKEWENSYKKADLIDLERPQNIIALSHKNILKYSKFARFKEKMFYPIIIIDQIIGKIGNLIKRKTKSFPTHNPNP